MKLSYLITAVALFLFVGCGGSGEEQQEQPQDQDITADEQQQETESPSGADGAIEIIGTDNMKFAVAEESEGLGVGETVQSNGEELLLLESITVEPGEEVTIELTTQSDMPASAMSHNWVLLAADADGNEFAQESSRAQDNDYIAEDLEDQVLANTEMISGEDEPTTVTFTAPEEPGEYEYICSFPGHYAGGMVGTLIVE